MKNWWLSLYTYPALKSIARASGIVFVATMLLYFFAPQFLFLVGLLSCYICYSQYGSINTSLRSNIEFHKLHIPYFELRKILVKDSIIRASALLIGSFISNCFAYLNNGFTGVEDIILFYSMPIMFQLISISMVTSINQVVNRRVKYLLFDHSKNNIFMWLLYYGGIFVLSVFILFIIPWTFNFHPLYPVAFFAVGVFIFHNVFVYKATLHQEKNPGTFGCLLRYTGKGALTGMGLYILVALVTHPLINNHHVNIDVRNFAFIMNGAFVPELDIESAKEFIKINRDSDFGEELALVMRNTPGINEVPFSDLIKKPRNAQIITYLKEVENPTAANLKYLMVVQSKMKTDQLSVAVMNHFIIEKWPKNQKFPEEFLTKVNAEKRLPASTEESN